jgi:hypothetical protein
MFKKIIWGVAKKQETAKVAKCNANSSTENIILVIKKYFSFMVIRL